jgi:hypothetical protein
VLGDRFDDQVAVGEVAEVGGEGQPGRCGLVTGVVELAVAQGLVEGAGDPGATRRDGGRVDFVDEDV